MVAFSEESGNLMDALTEHDMDDVDFGPPEAWPSWTRLTVIGLGPPLIPDEVLPDPDTPEDGTSPDSERAEPDQADVDFLLDLEEREVVERAWGCNARFAPDCNARSF